MLYSNAKLNLQHLELYKHNMTWNFGLKTRGIHQIEMRANMTGLNDDESGYGTAFSLICGKNEFSILYLINEYT